MFLRINFGIISYVEIWCLSIREGLLKTLIQLVEFPKGGEGSTHYMEFINIVQRFKTPLYSLAGISLPCRTHKKILTLSHFLKSSINVIIPLDNSDICLLWTKFLNWTSFYRIHCSICLNIYSLNKVLNYIGKNT